LVIPWPLVAVTATVLMAIVGGTVAINVQLAAMKERVDILYAIEMQRYPRQGPAAPSEVHP